MVDSSRQVLDTRVVKPMNVGYLRDVPPIPHAQSVKEIEQLLRHEQSPESLCAAIAKVFQVRHSEVALLELRGQLLSFVFPPELRAAGAIPVSSSAVAARTAQTNKAELFNRFTEVNHFSIFESVKAGGEPAPSGQTIQKLMSAPIVNPNGQVLGVIQVSRKASRPAIAGPDFTPADLEKLAEIARFVSKFMGENKTMAQTAGQN